MAALIISTCFTLAAAACLVIFGILVRKINEPAPDNPASAAMKTGTSGNRKRVVFAGASIIRGNVSFNVPRYVAAALDNHSGKMNGQEWDFVNAGINGDLSCNLLERLDEIIACKPTHVCILIGTNDATSTLSPHNAGRTMKLKNLVRKPSLDWYRENINAIVKRFRRETEARIAVITLPLLGEDAGSPANGRIAEFNEIIRETARINAVECIDFCAAYAAKLKDILTANGRETGKRNEGAMLTVFIAGIKRLIFGVDYDLISAANDFYLTTDGLHLNNISGRLLGEKILGFLSGEAEKK